jgi:hypothetical protein
MRQKAARDRRVPPALFSFHFPLAKLPIALSLLLIYNLPRKKQTTDDRSQKTD